MKESEQVVITPYRDGPLIVRGPARLQNMHGEEIRPLCDGTHKVSRFRAPSGLETA